PLPIPPSDELLLNKAAIETIKNNPHLFAIITPINYRHFYDLLHSHPNRALVHSVCLGFRDGFWPWANTHDSSRPITWDNSFRPLKDPSHETFVYEQCQIEQSLQRFSPSFGPDLLPGMSSIPVGVVPKPHTSKLRLVVDHSAEPYSLNAMIPRESVSVPLDNLHLLGKSL
ncbi:hypothetical protein M422DRAFT_122863, partial [Sphaerobolus stellatus SS14]